MSRWSPDAPARLRAAAFDLFGGQGFAATTVAQIAAHAGLTTRTFFRHYADKREVIFGGDEIPEFARRLMALAPADVAPLDLIAHGLAAVARDRFQDRRDQVRMVRGLIASDDSLQERDLRKRAALAAAVADGFRLRGLSRPAAAVLADTAVTVLHVALDEWLDRSDDVPLAAILADTQALLVDACRVRAGAE